MLPEFVDGNDFGVVECRCRTCFLLEAPQPIAICGERGGDNLDCHTAIQAAIPRPVHLAHPASAQWGDDLIRSELRAGGEQHSARHYIPQQGLGVDLRLSRADLPPRQARNDVPTGLGEIASPFSPKRLCYPLGAFSPRFSKWHAITGVTLRPSCSAVSCGCYATQRAADVPGPSNAANVSHSAG